MAYSEHIYVQKSGTDANGNQYPVFDMVEEWGIYGMEIPYKSFGDAKELYSNDWFDEDGIEEYVPEKIPVKSIDLNIQFALKGKSVINRLFKFMNFMNGTSVAYGKGSEFNFYSTWIENGWQKVRFVSIDDNATIYKEKDSEMLIVNITLRIPNPNKTWEPDL